MVFNCISLFFFKELFESVKKEEFRVPEGEGGLAETFFNPEREGWLTKEGGKYKSKHKRWFILKEGMLYYFKQPSVSETKPCCGRVCKITSVTDLG